LGLDIEPFVNGQDEKRQRFRKKYGLEENESAIGLVGRIVKVKNHGFFLQVASRLSKEMKREVKFFIVGDGNLRKKLEAEAVALQLEPVSLLTSKEGKLVFTSWIREIDEVMAGLDIVTLTSFNEGTPVSLLEAQAAGKPIVAINVGGTADTMLDEESGFLLKDFDSDLFAQKLEWLVRHKSEAIQMGRKGREYVKSTHPFKLQVEKTLQLYKSLLSNLKGSPNLRTG
jgi:glycosyltransferase involved in cell wall biosynthesis